MASRTSNTMHRWTQEEVSRLTTMYESGQYTRSQIARALGVSNNAVKGKIQYCKDMYDLELRTKRQGCIIGKGYRVIARSYKTGKMLAEANSVIELSEQLHVPCSSIKMSSRNVLVNRKRQLVIERVDPLPDNMVYTDRRITLVEFNHLPLDHNILNGDTYINLNKQQLTALRLYKKWLHNAPDSRILAPFKQTT